VYSTFKRKCLLLIAQMRYNRIKSSKLARSQFKQVELKKYVVSLLNKVQMRHLILVDGSLLSRVQLKNYCVLSGRARGILRDFKLSRILLRKVGAKGYITGLRKRSW
jgi:small subunit ribosomal protein S14